MACPPAATVGSIQGVVLRHNCYVCCCVSIDSFVFSYAANQLAEFLAFHYETKYVGVVTTFGNYRSCISRLFSVLFTVNLSDSARIKAVIDGHGKDHPAQLRWRSDQGILAASSLKPKHLHSRGFADGTSASLLWIPGHEALKFQILEHYSVLMG